MPGRDFTSPTDFNTQFTEWLTRANARVVRTIKARPVDLPVADKAAMLPLPPVAPLVGWTNRVRLGRDYCVRIDASDYSVDPAVIGRLVDVHADLQQVQIRVEGRLVARHDRVWALGRTLTDPAHVDAAKLLREQFREPLRCNPDVPHCSALLRLTGGGVCLAVAGGTDRPCRRRIGSLSRGGRVRRTDPVSRGRSGSICNSRRA